MNFNREFWKSGRVILLLLVVVPIYLFILLKIYGSEEKVILGDKYYEDFAQIKIDSLSANQEDYRRLLARELNSLRRDMIVNQNGVKYSERLIGFYTFSVFLFLGISALIGESRISTIKNESKEKIEELEDRILTRLGEKISEISSIKNENKEIIADLEARILNKFDEKIEQINTSMSIRFGEIEANIEISINDSIEIIMEQKANLSLVAAQVELENGNEDKAFREAIEAIKTYKSSTSVETGRLEYAYRLAKRAINIYKKKGGAPSRKIADGIADLWGIEIITGWEENLKQEINRLNDLDLNQI